MTRSDIAGLGFYPEMFSQDAEGFAAILDDVLAEQGGILASRLGALYDSPSCAVLVKRAEKCLCGAEMVQRRINVLLGNVSGAGTELDTRNEQRQRDDYRKEAEQLVTKVASGGITDGADFASGVVTSGGNSDAGS